MTHRFNLKMTGAAVALALAGFGGAAQAAAPGYVSNSSNQIWTTPYGLCWRTTDWSPEKAAAPCDAVPRVAVAAPPPVAVAPPPPVAAAPTPLVTPQPPLIEKVSVSEDVLFAFDKAELKPEGHKTLDEISKKMTGANVQEIDVIGHTDRIGTEQYNQQLSEKRAAAVKAYLAQKGIESDKVKSEGRGKAEPVTGDQCKGMRGDKLISCLQPDRRVDVEVRGERETASTSTSPSAGTSSSSGTLGTPSGSSTGASPSSGASSGSTK